MNSQTVVRHEVNPILPAKFPQISLKPQMKVKVQAPQRSRNQDLTSILTNGDPPRLMLWGSEE